MIAGSNLVGFLEGERAVLLNELNGVSRERCRASSALSRREAAVAHNHWPCAATADEALSAEDRAREDFRATHKKAAQLRDEIAAIEVDLGYDVEEW